MITKRTAGFTLIELMVGVTILALLLTLAAPDFSTTIADNRLQTRSGELLTALNLARSEAVKRVTPTTLCPSNAAGDDCAPAGDWSGGWLLFVNNRADADRVDAGDEIVRYYEPLEGPLTLSATGAVAAAGVVTYGAGGFAGQAGSFVLCSDGRLDRAQAVNLYLGGRPQPAPDVDGDGVPEAGDGSEFSGC